MPGYKVRLSYLEKKLEQCLRLLVLQTNDSLGEARVDIEGLLPSSLNWLVSARCFLTLFFDARSYRMNTDDGMFRLDRFPTNKLAITSRVLSLWVSAVLGPQAFEKLLDGLGKASVRSHLRSPSRVTPGWWDGEQCQDGDPGWLMLVGNVRVISRGRQPIVPLPSAIFVIRTQVNVVELEVILDMGADWLLRMLDLRCTNEKDQLA